MQNKIIKIKDIVVDEKFYPREKLIEATVKTYAKAMKEGDIFPRPELALFEGKYLLIDGRHRIEAFSLNGEEYVTCNIYSHFTNKNDIYIASIKSNLKHGKQLSLKDKLKIAYHLKDLKYDIEDISKLLHLGEFILKKLKYKNINKFTTFKENKDLINNKSVITDKLNEKTDYLTNVIEEKEEQLMELSYFLDYLQNTKIKKEEDVKALLIKIRQEINKILG